MQKLFEAKRGEEGPWLYDYRLIKNCKNDNPMNFWTTDVIGRVDAELTFQNQMIDSVSMVMQDTT